MNVILCLWKRFMVCFLYFLFYVKSTYIIVLFLGDALTVLYSLGLVIVNISYIHGIIAWTDFRLDNYTMYRTYIGTYGILSILIEFLHRHYHSEVNLAFLSKILRDISHLR